MIDINLIPASPGKRSAGAAFSTVQLGIPPKVFWGVGGGVVAILVLAHVILLGLLVIEGGIWLAHRAVWQSVLPQKKNIDTLGGEVRDLKKRMTGITDVTSARTTGWSRKLNTISDCVTKGLWLRRMTLDEKALVIEGSVISRDQNEIASIGAFVNNLKKDGSFMQDLAGLEVNSITREKRGVIDVANFTLTAKFK